VANGNDTELPTLSPPTAAGIILGTVGYMSPEQIQGKTPDARSDIFSLGCVLYEMVFGQRPFRGGTPAETLAAILKDTPTAPSARGAPIPAELERIVAHCLEKTREERFESARDLAFALKAVSVSAATAVAVEGARSGPPSVAVLPFLNLSADPENEFFTDGITEDVIAHLSKIRSLKVISRTSVMQFKKSERSMRESGAMPAPRRFSKGAFAVPGIACALSPS
jgi:serine/threonine-protein kinase